jgi:hypothetical protein
MKTRKMVSKAFPQFHSFLEDHQNQGPNGKISKIDFLVKIFGPFFGTVLQKRMKLFIGDLVGANFILSWRTVKIKGQIEKSQKSIFWSKSGRPSKMVDLVGHQIWPNPDRGNPFDTIFRAFILFSFFSCGTIQIHWQNNRFETSL